MSDIETILDCVHEDIAHDRIGAVREIGADAFRWYLVTHARHFNEKLSDIVLMTNVQEQRVGVELTRRGSYQVTLDGWPRAHGQSYSLPSAMFFTLESGIITRLSCFHDERQWKAVLDGKY